MEAQESPRCLKEDYFALKVKLFAVLEASKAVNSPGRKCTRTCEETAAEVGSLSSLLGSNKVQISGVK